jgi:hypothetical protein
MAAGELTDHLGRIAVAHDQVPAEVVVEGGEAAGEEPAPVRARRRPEPVVEHEQRDHPAAAVAPVGDRRGEGVVVGQAQIAPEPHDRVRHGTCPFPNVARVTRVAVRVYLPVGRVR